MQNTEHCGESKPSPLKSCYSYLELGLPIIPCCTPNHSGMSQKHRTTCKSPGKAPLIKGWTSRTKTTAAELEQWQIQWPHANPGLPLGNASGYVGVDIDGETGENLLAKRSGGDVTVTWEFTTGSPDSRRLIYSIPDGVTLKKYKQADTTKEHAELALLGEGQQTVIPPAVHSSGKTYKWAPGRDPFTFGPPAPAPQWMIDLMAVKKVTPIAEARSKKKKVAVSSDPVEVLDKLAEKCPRFSIDLKQQRDGGVDEDTWYMWLCVLVSAGYSEAAEVFSTVSTKHDDRSISRLGKLIARQDEDPLPPVRCTTLGCTEAEIKTCHKKIRVNRDGDITNSPAAFIMSRAQVVRRYFSGGQFIPRRLGEHIMEDYYLLFAGEKLFIYKDGVYCDGGAEFVRHECKERLGDQFKKDRVNETLYYIETSVNHKPDELNTRQDLINVKNGLLEWRTGKLLTHNPKYLSTIQLPLLYDPSASCPNTERFWREVLPEDCIPTVEEIFGISMTTLTKYETAFMLTGIGANGKGTLINQLTAFIGKQNISNVPLQDLGEHRFKRAELFSKLLNIFADLDKKALQSTGYFKMITSGDEIDAERKHRDPFFFRPFAKLVFSANELPRTSDQTHAFFRRWIIIPFEKRFTRGENADVRLLEKITTERELSGVLNHALVGLRRLDATDKFTHPQATRDALETYKLANDSAAAFVKECCIVTSNARVSTGKLYVTYKNWCVDGGMRPLSNRKFYARLMEIHPSIVKARPGGLDRMFYGIGLEIDTNF
ncbi:hypothetical protein SPSYN_03030 [Sporotomaculum syntrophicum]|uniref:SF3 helicase domain-containing protein n=1 Tax=Sporotomaculum syntrophicum TaxID=182264 RepID=A0A9D2WMA1_9FIRM|nr:phage/plasmid primase, P4 family [Sporotomaculum syntrophicum]KAF1083874.1 hypothetical protein SPSYN_03030 [Sporotomaculum syntrophicum]